MSPAQPAGKTPDESAVTMTELVLPQHTNALGTIFGGAVMGWIDIAGAIAAERHAGRVCVTASVDELHFLRPIKEGDIVNIRARLTAAHRTSCEVLVEVVAENTKLREKSKTTEATMTFVAIDSQGHATPIPSLIVKTKEEKELQKRADARKNQRDVLRHALLKKTKTK